MYAKAELEVVEFENEDVILTSGAAGSDAADAGAGDGYKPENPYTLPWDEEYD